MLIKNNVMITVTSMPFAILPIEVSISNSKAMATVVKITMNDPNDNLNHNGAIVSERGYIVPSDPPQHMYITPEATIIIPKIHTAIFCAIDIVKRLTSSYWGTNAGGKGVRAKGVDGNWNEN